MYVNKFLTKVNLPLVEDIGGDFLYTNNNLTNIDNDSKIIE